ncbi:MAG: hypothetical protein V4539_24085 [Bacteroidota bacterium]
MTTYFKDFSELAAYIQSTEKKHITITHQAIPDYAGMVFSLAIIFDAEKKKYELDMEWISFGLDLYAENLLEGYLYKFKSLEELTGYLYSKYQIRVSDIPANYKIEHEKFPDPIKDKEQKTDFEEGWQRFQRDFKEGIFLDASLELVYSTHSV